MLDFPYDVEFLHKKDGIEVVIDRGIYHKSLDVAANGAFLGKIEKKSPRFFIDNCPDQNEININLSVSGALKKYLFQKKKFTIEHRPPQKLRIQGVGSGRSGTQSLARYLDGLRFNDGEAIIAKHETVAMTMLRHILRNEQKAFIETTYSYEHNVEVAPYFWLVPESLTGQQICHLIRDGRQVVASGMQRGWYRRDTPWDKIKPDYKGDRFQNSCHLWAQSNALLAARSKGTFRLEDLAVSSQARTSMLKAFDIASSDKPFPLSNQAKGPIAGANGWTQREKNVFDEICGQQMDTFYPGWRTDY